MFVRVKKIKGNEYGYLVSNQWTSKGPRQKTQGYLGRVVKAGIERIDENALRLPDEVDSMDYQELADWMVQHNLELAGFQRQEGLMVLDDIEYDIDKRAVRLKGRPVCLKLNEGMVCEHTIIALRDFSRSGDDRRDIVLFAETVVSAGVKLTKDVFVKMFTKLPKPKMEEQELGKFEY